MTKKTTIVKKTSTATKKTQNPAKVSKARVKTQAKPADKPKKPHSVKLAKKTAPKAGIPKVSAKRVSQISANEAKKTKAVKETAKTEEQVPTLTAKESKKGKTEQKVRAPRSISKDVNQEANVKKSKSKVKTEHAEVADDKKRSKSTEPKKAKEAKPKKEKEPSKRQAAAIQYSKPIANLKEINSKSNLTNSDFILAILEISLNAQKYGIEFLNKSKCFWEAVTALNQFQNIFLKFKPETLRKYWRFLSDVRDVEKLLETVKKFKGAIDESETRLLTVISVIKGFIDGKIKDLQDYLKNYALNALGDAPKKGEGKLTSKKRKRPAASAYTMQFHGKNAQGVLSNNPWTPKKKFDPKAKGESKKSAPKKAAATAKAKVAAPVKSDNIYKIRNSTIKQLHAEFPKLGAEDIFLALHNKKNDLTGARETLKQASKK